jgi:hypothetical protein
MVEVVQKEEMEQEVVEEGDVVEEEEGSVLAQDIMLMV